MQVQIDIMFAAYFKNVSFDKFAMTRHHATRSTC